MISTTTIKPTIRIFPIVRNLFVLLSLAISHSSWSQSESSQQKVASLPEEIVVTGSSSLMNLRLQMLDAEKRVYDVFNQFNDEKRFMISCSKHQPTGSRLETQVCQPAFERDALAQHGQAFLANFRALNEPLAFGGPGEAPVVGDVAPPMHFPAEARIASQRGDYQRKMQQVAEEHPEFLEAIIRYTTIKDQYESAVKRTR